MSNENKDIIYSHKIFYFFTPQTNNLIEVTFQTLSYREINSLEVFRRKGQINYLFYKTCELAIKQIVNKQNKKIHLEDLTIATIKEIGEYILSVSDINVETLNTLYESIDIYFDKQFQNKTWDCSYCKTKGLDRVRNCGYRNEKNKKKDFKVYVGDRVYTYCPIYDIDKHLVMNAVECYNAFEKGLLPDSGGLYDQTKFFYLASFKLHEKIQKEEMKELKEAEMKNKLNF